MHTMKYIFFFTSHLKETDKQNLIFRWTKIDGRGRTFMNSNSRTQIKKGILYPNTSLKQSFLRFLVYKNKSELKI